MTQTSEMGTKRGAKKTSRKPPFEQSLPPLPGPNNNPAPLDLVLVDLDPTPLSRKRRAEIKQEELENLAREGIKVTRFVLVDSLLDDDDETSNEIGAPHGPEPASAILPSTSLAQPFGTIRFVSELPVQPPQAS